MIRFAHVAAAVAATFTALCFAGCAAEPSGDDSGVIDDEAVGSAEEALHEQACLNNYDAADTIWYNNGTCGGTYSTTLSSNGTTYGTADCNNQFRARWTIAQQYVSARPRVQWNGVALTSSGACGVALLTGSFWAKRRSDNVWVRLADSEYVGRWTGSSCVFDTPVSGWDAWPSFNPATYGQIHVAASASYLFQKQPVRVALAYDPPSC